MAIGHWLRVSAGSSFLRWAPQVVFIVNELSAGPTPNPPFRAFWHGTAASLGIYELIGRLASCRPALGWSLSSVLLKTEPHCWQSVGAKLKRLAVEGPMCVAVLSGKRLPTTIRRPMRVSAALTHAKTDRAALG